MAAHKDHALQATQQHREVTEDATPAADNRSTVAAGDVGKDNDFPRPEEASDVTLTQVSAAIKQSEITAEQMLEAVKHSELTAEQLLNAVKSRQVATSATDSALGPNPFVGFRGKDIGDTTRMLIKQAVTNPVTTVKHLARFTTAEVRVLRGKSALTPAKGDRRFTDPTWSENPLYRRGLQTYLAIHQELERWVDDTMVDQRDAERARFVLSLITEALAPSNWVFNPAALKRLLETGGASAVRGIRHLLSDIRHNGFMPSMTDKNAFKVGENLANTPGAVVFRHEMFELIQYAPRAEKVFRRPFLFVPPQINKFYLYDLAPKKSLIRYALDNGLQVFAISWRNPTPEHRHWGIDHYVQAIDEAIDVIRDITASEDCNILGGCAGGITTTSLLAYLTEQGVHKVNSQTLLVTLLDMSAETQLGLFATEEAIEAAKRHSAKKGVLEGGEMARVFAWLRPNDLIWNYWVNNYLVGNEPPAFDILFWNADTTRLPAAFHADLLTVVKENSLVRPGALTVLGTPVDLAKINCDIFWMAGYTDHITPWDACYQSVRLLGGECEFVLSSGGHIQSMLSAPGNPKNSFFTNPQRPTDPEVWLAGALEHQGSWWEHWRTWIIQRSGNQKKAPPKLGNTRYPPLQDAPGTYIYG